MVDGCGARLGEFFRRGYSAAQAGIAIDGDLAEWDQNGFIETSYDRSLYPNFSLRIGFLHDAGGLCIGAHVVDATPLVNATEPAVNPKEGWMSDCLQARLISDPTAPNPYARKPGGKDTNDAICHLTIWYCTAKQQAAVSHEYGMDFHGLKTYVGQDSGVVFRKDADGKLWVTENDEFPRRVSVWDTAGKNIGDYHGPCVPQIDCGVDPEHPERINCQMVEYQLDYGTGKYKCLATLWRPHVDGWTPVENFGRAARLLIRHAQASRT